MVNEGKELVCLVCGQKAKHFFTVERMVAGSKVVAPIVLEGRCRKCGVSVRWNDWSYAWLTGAVAVVLFGFVIAIINYMRRMKKN